MTATTIGEAKPARLPLGLTVPGWWRMAASMAGAFIVFALLLVANGTNPIDGYRAMWDSVARDANSFGDVLVRLTPYLLAALAVAIPARAGLLNIGGEGQLLVGAVGAMATANALGQAIPHGPTLVMMALAAMAAAGLWAGLAAALRSFTTTNEAITTLLFNYLAFLLLGWLTFGRWKDPAATGFPRTRLLTEAESLPILWGRVHVGIVVAILVALTVWAVMRFTPFGFQLGVLGANREAARRAGFPAGRLSAIALMAGGAVAGLGGMLQFAGVEQQLRPQMMTGYGFTGVLAAWMVRHHPLRAIPAAALLAAIAVGGNGLKIRAGLSAASVNILMALLLLAVLGWGTARSKEARR
jgi:simple sugar transport system permease protein